MNHCFARRRKHNFVFREFSILAWPLTFRRIDVDYPLDRIQLKGRTVVLALAGVETRTGLPKLLK